MKFWNRKTPDQQASEWIDSVSPSTVVNDGFYNSKTGVGDVPTGKESTQFWPEYFLPEETLSDMVDCYWLAKRCVRALPEAAHQDEIIFEKESDKLLWEKIDSLEGNDDGAFLTADIWARTHGCSLLILGQNWGGSPETPFDEGAPIEWLEPLSSCDFTVGSGDLNEDKADPRRYQKPNYYRIVGAHRFNGLRIHHSRVVHFTGPSLADHFEHSRDYRKMQQASVLDAVHRELARYSLSWSAISSMIQQGSIPVWELKGLIAGLSSTSELRSRFKLQNEQVSVMNAVLLDAGSNEKYTRQNVSLTDVPETMKQLAIQVAAAADIPVSELFGKLISGLGESGEVDDEKWQRSVDKHRTKVLNPRLRKILPGVKYAWKPISIPDAKERSEVFRAYWDMGQVTNEETRELTAQALGLGPLSAEGKAELESRNNAASTIVPSTDPFNTGNVEIPETDPNADPDS